MATKKIFKQIISESIEFELPGINQRQKIPDLPLDSKKIVVLYGPRRSGKTFCFYKLIKDLRKTIDSSRLVYINFEDDRLLPLTSQELNLFIEGYYELYPENKDKKVYLFFDEIQNIEAWETFVRRIDDKEKLQIFITGSSAKLLSKEIATSLRGRSISYSIYPLSFKEYLTFKNIELKKNYQFSKQRFDIIKALEEFIKEGGFPEVVLSNNAQIDKKILQEYFDSLVYKDLIDRYKIRNSTLLKDLLKALFTYSTRTFSVNNYHKTIKQYLSVSKDTIHEYLSYITETNYVFLLPIFSYSLKEQRVNSKKIIALDNGLRNKVSFKFSSDYGKLAENLVGLELIRRFEEVFYWEKDHEVDFVVKDKSKLIAINVCYGDEIPEREIKSLKEFSKLHENVKEMIILTKDIEDKQKNISFIPLWEWLLRVS